MGPDRFALLLDDAVAELATGIDHVSVAVTGLGWLGSGIPAVERTMIELVAAAQREIMLTAYSLTPGSERVLETLERALESGIQCHLLVNRTVGQHGEIQHLLRRLLAANPGVLTVHDFVGEHPGDGLHAKILVVDRRFAVVGSSNLTLHGMVTAHELALIVRGPTAEIIAEQIDRLLTSSYVRRFE